MPVNRKKVADLVTVRFRQGRWGGPGVKDLDKLLKEEVSKRGGKEWGYQGYADFEVGKREWIYLHQLEALAAILNVPVTELLDQESANASYEAGMSAGVALAAGSMQEALNAIITEHIEPPDREELPEAVH